MIVRAPGKVILSGAYAVLYGAPAIVTAVDRYVNADSEQAADFVTPEMRAAFGNSTAPRFDATALRDGDRKLGLGSSAAILVASLAARYPSWLATPEGRAKLLDTALVAHRKAQGGGSGVDVLSSIYGGTLVARKAGESGSKLDYRAVTLPKSLFIEVWACPTAAETRKLIARVDALLKTNPERHGVLIGKLTRAAESAVAAVDSENAAAFVQALQEQARGFEELGQAAGAPIITPDLDQIIERAASPEVAILPAGAGGGDIALYVGLRPPSAEIIELARALAHNPLTVRLGAKGAHVEGSA